MGKTKRNKSVQKKRLQSREAHKDAPLSMSQEDIDAIVAGRSGAEDLLARRLRAASPSDAPLKVKRSQVSGKASPPRITRSEMATITGKGKVSRRLTQRLERRAATQLAEDSKIKKPYQDRPGDAPPGVNEES